MAKEDVYRFKGIDDLYADKEGNFFYKDSPARKVYNNDTISILCGKSKKGLIKLRRLAYKGTMEDRELPF